MRFLTNLIKDNILNKLFKIKKNIEGKSHL